MHSTPTNPSFAERVVKSFGFSLVLFLIWGAFTVTHVRKVLEQFSPMQAVWVVYNATLAVLFLVRSRPSVVSLNPIHWVVALATSFSGFFFRRYEPVPETAERLGEVLVLIGVVLSGIGALSLGRSYDVFPALRGVTTKGLYAVVRHPMYVASMILRLGYLAANGSLYNVAGFVVMVGLYSLRAAFEESTMQSDERYREYARRVRYRFVPAVY